MVDLRFLYLIYIPAGIGFLIILVLWWLIESFKD